MENVISHIPLALFTTLGALGAGAYIGLAIYFFTGKCSDEDLKAIDKRTVIPFVVALIGFIAVLFHVTQPLKAYGVFSGVGSSPLSNEVVAGVVFMVFAAIYTILALAGKLGGARKGLIAITAVLAVVFGIMMGMAYMVDTIPTWCNPGTIMQMLGYTLGGSALALVVIGKSDKAAPTIKVVALVGVVLAVIGVVVQIVICMGASAATESGAALVASVLPLIIVAAVAAVVALVLLWKNNAAVACVILLVAVFCGRLAFYGMELGIGL